MPNDHPAPGAASPEESYTTEPRFLRLFTLLRTRPTRREIRVQNRLRRLAARRLPPHRPEPVQRGDIAEPPPVLDLRLADPADREPLIELLRRRCGTHPVWVLRRDTALTATAERTEREPRRVTRPAPQGRRFGPPLARGRPGGGSRAAEGAARESTRDTGPEAPAEATTAALYDELAALARRFDREGEPGGFPRGRTFPPAPRFRRLRSLLWLRAIDLPSLEQWRQGSDYPCEGAQLPVSRESEGFVVEALRDVRAGMSTRRYGAPRWTDGYFAAMRRLSALVARMSARISTVVPFAKVDEKVLTPTSFVLSALATVTPVASLGLVVEQMDEAITVLAAVFLLGLYVALALFLILPWRPFRWLNRHRYPLEPGQTEANPLNNHRERGIRVLNVLYRHRDTSGGIDVRSGRRPPGIHRLGVNAFLDDLDRSHGSGRFRHRWSPRRKRHRRPVLIVDQDRVGAAGRHLVRLIEDERLRRRYPDPLLIVLVRATAKPILENALHTERYPVLPEARGNELPEETEVSAWLRERQAAGALGRERLITCRVPPLSSEGWDELPRSEGRELVWNTAALTGFWSAGAATVLALTLTAGGLALPTYMQRTNPCVMAGDIRPPEGIWEEDGDCVGITDGEFPFDDRLAAVQREIERENRRLEEEDADYVTIVYTAAMSVTSGGSGPLAGVHGELYGLAHRQAQHNSNSAAGVPKIRLLLANTGARWEHARSVAERIVERAEDTGLDDGDRVLAAVGFGHSVRRNTEMVEVLSAAMVPMVGSTATYDEVAHLPSEVPSSYFFPIAPSNSRIAAQVAGWVREGVRWRDDEGREWRPGPADSAVALADAATGETYGPHLAERFMAEFQERGGQAWSDGRDTAVPVEGVLHYGPEGTSVSEHLERVCADPPDLIYFAGRSSDFAGFHEQLQDQGACAEAEVTILGGDDIAKYVTDNARELGNAGGFPVYYTPLAASGPWSRCTSAEERPFYDHLDDLIRRVEESPAADSGERSPSVAHAAVANDALKVLS